MLFISFYRLEARWPLGNPCNPPLDWQRLLFASVYKTTIPSSRAPWEYLLLPIFHRNPAGHDWPGRKNWASNKPHAVIAHGAAMQRVPGSLRFLQKTCQEEGVPLYIIHDARVWGGNTHQTLPEALQDLRKDQSSKILYYKQCRVVVRFVEDGYWDKQKQKQSGKPRILDDEHDKRYVMPMKSSNENVKMIGVTLNATELQHKLVGHNVIVIRDGKDKEEKTQYTSGMVELSRKCVADVAEQEGLQEKESIPKTIDAVDSEENGSQPA